MIHGMTGFSTQGFLYRQKRWVVTIRSVNHKFFDCVISLPDELQLLEDKVKKELRGSLHRGRVVFSLSSLDLPERKVLLNKKLLGAYLECMKDISRTLHIGMDVSVAEMVHLPEVVSLRPVADYAHKDFASAFTRSMRFALKKLLLMRKKEGAAIAQELRARAATIHRKLAEIRSRAAGIIAANKARLVDEELRDFLKAYNIEEEVNRLAFHIKSFKNTLAQSGPLGKVLDFIVQEMQREINTLSAKFRDARVSYLSIVIKDELEKIREQLANVE